MEEGGTAAHTCLSAMCGAGCFAAALHLQERSTAHPWAAPGLGGAVGSAATLTDARRMCIVVAGHAVAPQPPDIIQHHRHLAPAAGKVPLPAGGPGRRRQTVVRRQTGQAMGLLSVCFFFGQGGRRVPAGTSSQLLPRSTRGPSVTGGQGDGGGKGTGKGVLLAPRAHRVTCWSFLGSLVTRCSLSAHTRRRR